MANLSYEIGRISGILEGFAGINNKTNHGFTFEIELLDPKIATEESVTNYLTKFYPDSTLSFTPISEWRTVLSSYIEKWLFCYQPHNDAHGNVIAGECGSYYSYLKDVDRSFSLFIPDSRRQFIDDLCDALNRCLVITRAIDVHLVTDAWYEGDWNDIALEGENARVFIHLGVSD
ncbi:hypothetical protein [Celerinatantimonas sp. MCCC 1A17872]|uniref:hypothetical protein n=1 Tax=Celerinatantimonas sp. MCCC 1A17872 TaxID=3177514 RepID=UPI0038C0F5FB